MTHFNFNVLLFLLQERFKSLFSVYFFLKKIIQKIFKTLKDLYLTSLVNYNFNKVVLFFEKPDLAFSSHHKTLKHSIKSYHLMVKTFLL